MLFWHKISFTFFILISANIGCGNGDQQTTVLSEHNSSKRELDFEKITANWFPGLDKSLGINSLEGCLANRHFFNLATDSAPVKICWEERLLNESHRFLRSLESRHTAPLLKLFEQILEQEKMAQLRKHQALLSQLAMQKIMQEDSGLYNIRQRKKRRLS